MFVAPFVTYIFPTLDSALKYPALPLTIFGRASAACEPRKTEQRGWNKRSLPQTSLRPSSPGFSPTNVKKTLSDRSCSVKTTAFAESEKKELHWELLWNTGERSLLFYCNFLINEKKKQLRQNPSQSRLHLLNCTCGLQSGVLPISVYFSSSCKVPWIWNIDLLHLGKRYLQTVL